VLSIIVLSTEMKTYPVDGQNADVSYLTHFDGVCHTHTWMTAGGGGSTTDQAATFEEGTGGTVTLTSLSSMGVQGSFDVTFASGDHLSGTFSAGHCMPTAVGDGGGPFC
jgi:hypothetical protein